MYTDNYVVKSLELHLFFGRIMKEHALFLEAVFTPANPCFSRQAACYKEEFESLLCQAVSLSDGIVSRLLLDSGEMVTEFTLLAEEQTENFTGISINEEITRRELSLQAGDCEENIGWQMHCQVRRLNRKAMELLGGLIEFKEQILQNVLSCNMFTMNYPLLIEHILREAKLYLQYVETLEREGCLTGQTMADGECFWNRIMMEHALFIRGLLDPSEADLIRTSNQFAGEYEQLLKACCSAQDGILTDASRELTMRFRDFKTAGTEGIQQCEIRSIILPLLADHVLREANHYLRLLH